MAYSFRPDCTDVDFFTHGSQWTAQALRLVAFSTFLAHFHCYFVLALTTHYCASKGGARCFSFPKHCEKDDVEAFRFPTTVKRKDRLINVDP